MPESTHLSELTLTIDGTEDADEEMLDQLTCRLERELLDLEIEKIKRVTDGEAPEGTMSGTDAVTVNQLLLVTLPTVLPALIVMLHGWLMRNQGESRRVMVKTKDGLEVSFTPDKKYSEEELLKLVKKLSTK
jgi:hypothetical protein